MAAHAQLSGLGLAVVGDHLAGEGPLAGIATALAYARSKGLQRVVTVPVDAPLLSLDLVARLDAEAASEIAVATQAGTMEPLFAVWPVEFASEVAAALDRGERAVHRLIGRLPHRLVDFPAESDAPSPFLNLNTPDDLARFEQRFKRPAPK
jgi:molybdopterin-guanine dinucleotide biosynthesis protein A